MRVRGPSLILFVVVGAILPATVAGCAAARVGSPSEQEYAAARGGRAAVVLLRAVAETRKGGERTAFGPESGRGKAVSLVRLETGGNTKSVGPLRSPHARALRDGWIYLVLKPGTYYLLVHDRQPADLSPEFAAPGEDWLLEVPAGGPLVYAGTVVFEPVPAPETPAASPPPHAPHVPASVPTRVRDDSGDARKLAREYFPALMTEPGAAPRTVVVRRYSGPLDAGARIGGAGRPPPVVDADGAPRPTGFGVRGACAEDGAWFGLLYGNPILRGGGSSTNTAADVFLFAVKTGLYAWAGTGAIIGSVAGVAEARDLQPCVTQTVRWAADYDLSRRLSESLNARLAPGNAGAAGAVAGTPAGTPADTRACATGGPGAGDPLAPVVRVSVQELRLRPCTKAHLACIESKVRVRLWDPGGNRHEMDRILLYSNAAARHRTEPYGRPLQTYVLPVDQSPVLNLRALRRLPPERRRARVEAELDRAVAVLSERILSDLGLSSVPGPDVGTHQRPPDTSLPAATTRPSNTRPVTTRPATGPGPRTGGSPGDAFGRSSHGRAPANPPVPYGTP